MSDSKLLAGFFVFVSAILAGCGSSSSNSGGNNPPPPPPPPPPAPLTVQTQQAFNNVVVVRGTGMEQAPNDASRWFVIEKAGRILVFDNDPAATSTEFLDISGRVDSSANESGLLGVAFDPDFANNGEVIVSYTATGSPFISRISRFRSFDGNQTLDPMSEDVLLEVLQDFSNHNGGDVKFGPDGYLYAAFGDGGSGGDPNNRAQDQNNLLGTIIRIDVDIATGYLIPPDNPNAANPQCAQGFGAAPCPEIYAYGLRNPWRFSFDSMTGELWTGDVGQGSWEEVDRINLGDNLGWNVREGAHCFNPPSGCSTAFVDPITEYGRSEGASITGGYVYHGTAIPELQNDYVFGDFVSGRIWYVPANSPIGTAPIEIADTSHSISTFAQGADGEIYLIDYGGGGSIHQIVP